MSNVCPFCLPLETNALSLDVPCHWALRFVNSMVLDKGIADAVDIERLMFPTFLVEAIAATTLVDFKEHFGTCEAVSEQEDYVKGCIDTKYLTKHRQKIGDWLEKVIIEIQQVDENLLPYFLEKFGFHL